MKKLVTIVLFFLLFYTRFVGLDWGFPYPMHPDERNMAVAVEQLSCPPLSSLITGHLPLTTCFNPHFFAYGQFPLYLAYGGVEITHLLTGQTGQPNFLEATLALRVLSMISSLLLVFVLFKTIKLLRPGKRPLPFIFEFLSIVFLIFQPYAIQFAHFGTTESLLILFYALIIYYSLKLLSSNKQAITTLILLGIFSGLALGTKTSSLLFLGIPIVTIIIKVLSFRVISEKSNEQSERKKDIASLDFSVTSQMRGFLRNNIYKIIYHTIISLFTYLSITFIFFILSSPQSLLNWNDFVSSMNYESAVGLGTYIPFYTRQFVGTTPVLFQFQKILPYVLGWPTLIASILGFFLLPSYIKEIIILQVARVKGTRQRVQNSSQQALEVLEHWRGKLRVTESAKYIDLLRFALLLSFLPSSFFFAKWTRFIAPSFPLFSLFALLFLLYIFSKKKFSQLFTWTIFILTMIPGLAFLSIYISPDVRFIASDWIYKNIPVNSKILSETANVIDIPIPSPFSREESKNYLINSFNFYDVDTIPQFQMDLSKALNEADYIFVPSRRIFKNHPKTAYPYLADYYEKLAAKQLGFEKVAEFSSFPKIELFGKTLITFPDEEAEETWTVFDHPVIRIYKRIPISKISIPSQFNFSTYRTTNYQIYEKNYRLLIADTPEKWMTGLMYVKNKADINNFDGMIFTFPDSETRMFWNKNTLSHLTVYWVNEGKIIGASDLPSIAETKIVKTISSDAPADTVIEIIK